MHPRWQATAMSGEGAALYPGRWNNAGDRMVYLADSLALAVLETLVHLEATNADVPFIAISLELPDESVAIADPLPAPWQHDLARTRGTGTRWLRTGSSLALQVPSAIVPTAANLLVNPAHDAAKLIKEVARFEFQWDPRLL